MTVIRVDFGTNNDQPDEWAEFEADFVKVRDEQLGDGLEMDSFLNLVGWIIDKARGKSAAEVSEMAKVISRVAKGEDQ